MCCDCVMPFSVVGETDKLVGPKNFLNWFMLSISHFKCDNLFAVAMGKDKKDESKPLDEQIEWIKKDFEVQRAIINSVDKTLLIHLVDLDTGAEMYDKLQTLFGRDVNETDELMEKFFSLRYKTKTGFIGLFRDLENIAFRLNYNDVPISDELVMNRALTCLCQFNADFLDEWENMQESDKTLPNLKKKLIEADTWHQAVRDFEEEPCEICNRNHRGGRNCRKNEERPPKQNFCQPQGIFTFDIPRTYPKNPRCKICIVDDHKTETCSFRCGRPNRGNGYGTENSNAEDSCSSEDTEW